MSAGSEDKGDKRDGKKTGQTTLQETVVLLGPRTNAPNTYVFDVFCRFFFDLGISKGIIAVSIDTKPMRNCVAAEDMCLKRGMSLWLHPFLLVAHERKGAHASR
jgi:hypothetical protein